MSKLSRSEMQQEALSRAEQGASVANYPAIFEGFLAKGIAEADILPRENVFTFNAWKAKGRSVMKGEKGVKVVTWITCGDDDAGETYRRCQTTTVFHISQTELTADREARLATQRGEGAGNGANGYPGSYRRGRYQRRPMVEQGYPDPGELAADRWNELHGDRY